MGTPGSAGVRGRGSREPRRIVAWSAGIAVAVAALGGVAAPASAASPTNDAFRSAQDLALSAVIEMDTHGATVEAREPDPDCNVQAGASVWFSFTPTTNGRYAADTYLSGYDTTVAVYRGRWLGDLRPVACSDDAGGATSYAIFKGRAGVTYRIQVTGDHGDAGDLAFSVDYAPDLSPPNVGLPRPGFRLGAKLGVSAQASWHGWDRQSGVERYEVEVARDGGPYQPLTLPRPAATSVRAPLATDAVTRYRVRGVNHQGMVSDWSVGPASVAGIIEEDAPTVTRSAGWTLRPSALASGGGEARSTQAGARLTIPFTGRAVGLVAQRGPRRGEVRVLLDGRPAGTVDLSAAGRQPRRIVFSRSFAEAGPHTITIEVVGTAGRPAVDIDAIVIAADPAA